MSLNKKKILNVFITTSKREEVLEEIEKWLRDDGKTAHKIVTPNPEQVVVAQRDLPFRKILNQADVALPDGIGIAWFLGVPRIPGVEFMEDLARFAAKRGYTIGLIGGRAGVAVKALECLQGRYPGLRGWAVDPGLVSLGTLGDLGNIKEKIMRTRTRILFVGLGAPKQELFIERLCRKMSLRGRSDGEAIPNDLPAGRQGSPRPDTIGTRDDTGSVILMSVGGSFDILSGSIQRAPVFIRDVGIEWLWRLVREPWRFRRQLALMKFSWLVLCEKLASQGDALRS